MLSDSTITTILTLWLCSVLFFKMNVLSATLEILEKVRSDALVEFHVASVLYFSSDCKPRCKSLTNPSLRLWGTLAWMSWRPSRAPARYGPWGERGACATSSVTPSSLLPSFYCMPSS